MILGDVAEPTARVPDKFSERSGTRLGSDAAFGEFAGHLAKVVEGAVFRAIVPRTARRMAR